MASKRRQNFSNTELEILINEVEKRKTSLFSKLNNSVSKSHKTRLWEVIAERVNSANKGNLRTAEEIRKKWSNVASDAKKRTAIHRKEIRKTGEGPSEAVTKKSDEKVAGIISKTATEEISGGFDPNEQTPICDMNEESQGYNGQGQEEVLDLSRRYTCPCSARSSVDVAADETKITATDDESAKDESFTVKKTTQEVSCASVTSNRKRTPATTEATRLVHIEEKRLQVETERLAVESDRRDIAKERINIETRRLAAEEERLEIEKQRHSLYLQKLAGVKPVITYTDDA